MPDLPSGQVLAFDFGLRQLGVASAHSNHGIVSPVGVLPMRDGQAESTAISKLIKEWKPKLLVVGLPLNMDQTESELSQRARRFADWLSELSNLPVVLADERLTSREAKSMAGEMGHRGDYRRRPVDAIAACLILEQWLAEQASTG